MIKILFINPAGFIGGAEKSLLDLLANLPPKRFHPLVVLLSPGPLENELRKRGFECRVIPLPSDLLGMSRTGGKNFRGSLLLAPFLSLPAAARIWKTIREEEIAIVHTNGIKAHLLGILPALASGRPLVWHFRDLPGRGGYGRLFRFLARFFPSRIIANSFAVKQQLGDLDRIRVVYNGVDLPPGTSTAERGQRKRELGLDQNTIAIGTIGNFAPLKGYEDFLRAVPLVLEKISAARFLFTGDALYSAYRDYRRQLESEAARMGLADKIIFTGWRDQPEEVLAALDIFVLPSHSEGFGRANLEAMAAGLPVVSTGVGGIPEVVIDGETGILVHPRQPAALAEAIVTLAEDERLRRKLGENGRRRAEAFSIRKMADGVIAVYDGCLSGKKPHISA